MHEQIEALLEDIGTKIQDAAIAMFDRYVQELTEHVEAFRAAGGEVPEQFMLSPAFHDLVKSIINGEKANAENKETKLGVKIASDQVGFVIQDYLFDNPVLKDVGHG